MRLGCVAKSPPAPRSATVTKSVDVPAQNLGFMLRPLATQKIQPAVRQPRRWIVGAGLIAPLAEDPKIPLNFSPSVFLDRFHVRQRVERMHIAGSHIADLRR